MNKRYTKEELKKAAETIIENLKHCEEGTEFTTYELAEQYGFAGIDTMELFELHNALFKAAKTKKIRLDVSDHKDKVVGLPFHIPFRVIRKQ